MASPQPNVLGAPRRDQFPLSFWLLLGLTAVGSGLAAGLLMEVLRLVQHAAFGYDEEIATAGDFATPREADPAARRTANRL